jgi:hypothetical protein
MKTISSGMASHLSQEVTTLCTCWKIVRTDGQVFGFTDHDMDLTFAGLTYESETGYNRTAIRSDASLSVDNLDVSGFLESDRISENDLRNGVFDFASVYIFAVNWADLTQNEVKLRRGWFGEVVLNQNGMFETEIRGLHQALSFGFMESYQPECRADFCDSRCKLVYADYVRTCWAWGIVSNSQFHASSDAGTYTAPAASVGAHRYWKIQILTPGDAAQPSAFAEARFYDQTGAEVLGGTAAASSQFSGAFVPANARDGVGSTAWASTLADNHGHWRIDFGSAKDLHKIRLQARDTASAQTPVSFQVLYSDDNITYTPASTYSTLPWTTASEYRDFVGFGGTQNHIIPSAPAAGAITYIGGTVKFTSGPNTGRTIEIVGYDATSGLVTLFEAFPYVIGIGDRFELAQGCDKMFATCKLYANQNNFRGEPQVPGQDEMLSYPDAHD